MQQCEDVVFQWSDGPKRGRGAGFHLGKAAREPAEQIQGMNPLIEKLPTSGGLRLSTPFLLVPAPAPVSIHAAQEMQPADRAFFEQRVRFGQCREVTMAVAHFQTEALAYRGGHDGPNLAGIRADRYESAQVHARS